MSDMTVLGNALRIMRLQRAINPHAPAPQFQDIYNPLGPTQAPATAPTATQGAPMPGSRLTLPSPFSGPHAPPALSLPLSGGVVEAPPAYPGEQLRGILQGGQQAHESSIANAPNQYDLERIQSDAHAAGAKAALDLLTPPDPNALRFHPPAYSPQAYTPQSYTPQEYPNHAQAQIPQRPTPQVDPLGAIFSGIAGVFDPHAAGNFAAAPLRSAGAASDQGYADALRNYQLQQEQNNTAYNDTAANIQQHNQSSLYNIGEQNRVGAQTVAAQNTAQMFNSEQAVAADRALQQEKDAHVKAQLPFAMEIGEHGVLGPSVSSLSSKLRDSELSQAKADAAGQNVQLTQAEYADKYNKWVKSGSLEARIQSDQAKAQLELLKIQKDYFTNMNSHPYDPNGNPLFGGRGGIGGIGRTLTPNASMKMIEDYTTGAARFAPVPDSAPDSVKQDIEKGRAAGLPGVGKYTGDIYDERVKPQYQAYQRGEKLYNPIYKTESQKYDSGEFAPNGLQSELLAKAYADETGLVPGGTDYEAWKKIRFLSMMNPRVSAAYQTYLKPPMDALKSATDKLNQVQPKTPGAANATMGGQQAIAQKPNTSTAPKKKVYNPATGKIE